MSSFFTDCEMFQLLPFELFKYEIFWHLRFDLETLFNIQRTCKKYKLAVESYLRLYRFVSNKVIRKLKRQICIKKYVCTLRGSKKVHFEFHYNVIQFERIMNREKIPMFFRKTLKEEFFILLELWDEYKSKNEVSGRHYFSHLSLLYEMTRNLPIFLQYGKQQRCLSNNKRLLQFIRWIPETGTNLCLVKTGAIRSNDNIS